MMEQTGNNVRIQIKSRQEPVWHNDAAGQELHQYQDNGAGEEAYGSGSYGNDTESMEITAFGKYYNRNGIHYIFYDEWMEGAECATSNRITIRPESMELVRKGAVNTVMTFKENEMARRDYHTPYGTLTVGTDTSRLCILIKDDGLDVSAKYLLEVNGEYVSVNYMELSITFSV
ncbi:MAG: DUF1934 domain-containing protein [Clostridiales bacterium]|nr:DUF1934 domain-containing protein [Clostridiales bacterium]